jgi:hypothetical protein
MGVSSDSLRAYSLQHPNQKHSLLLAHHVVVIQTTATATAIAIVVVAAIAMTALTVQLKVQQVLKAQMRHVMLVQVEVVKMVVTVMAITAIKIIQNQKIKLR